MNSRTSRILCVILHYGSEYDTNNCISSIINEKDFDIVISDNDPRQSFTPPTRFKDLVSVIKTGGDAGFSEGNNIAVNAFLTSLHDCVFILNNDTIVTDGAINLLRSTLATSCVGAVGPCMPYASCPDKIWACGGYINKRTLKIGGIQPKATSPYEVDYLPGAAILCRADLWVDIGGFNEAYFLAYEEAELCLEIRKRGFKVMADPRSSVFHRVGMSSQRRPEYFYNDIRNKLVFSKYLYGDRAGFAYAIIATFDFLNLRSIKGLLLNLRLWIKALYDDAVGLKVTRGVLDSVSRIALLSTHEKPN